MMLGIYLQQDDDPQFTVRTGVGGVWLSCDGCGWHLGFKERSLFNIVEQAARHSRSHRQETTLTANAGGQR